MERSPKNPKLLIAQIRESPISVVPAPIVPLTRPSTSRIVDSFSIVSADRGDTAAVPRHSCCCRIDPDHVAADVTSVINTTIDIRRNGAVTIDRERDSFAPRSDTIEVSSCPTWRTYLASAPIS